MMDVCGKRVTVMGLGHFGGGVGVARWLVEQGADVLVTDTATPDKLNDSLAQIHDLVRVGGIRLRLGGHNISDFSDADLVVANPAVPRPWDNQFLRASSASGVPVTTEIRLLWERLPNPRRVIGITGSAGKSTTTAMCHHILTEAIRMGLGAGGAHRVHLGGNLGGSLLGAAIGSEDWVVLELSSAMMHWLRPAAGYASAPGYSPHVAVVTNIAENHIDWHGSLEHYAESKQQILRCQQPWDFAILGDGARDWPIGRHVTLSHVPEKPALEVPVRQPGRHNRLNAWVALTAAAFATGLRQEELAPFLCSFNGLPHRMQLVAEHKGTRFYNDSKATTPGATLLAVSAFEELGEVGAGRVHLIVGGYDKKVDLTSVAELSRRVACLYAVGAVGESIVAKARTIAGRVESCGTVETAVERALGRMKAGEVLLLSPACASWDQYINYEKRGERFTQCVRDMLPGTGGDDT